MAVGLQNSLKANISDFVMRSQLGLTVISEFSQKECFNASLNALIIFTVTFYCNF